MASVVTKDIKDARHYSNTKTGPLKRSAHRRDRREVNSQIKAIVRTNPHSYISVIDRPTLTGWVI